MEAARRGRRCGRWALLGSTKAEMSLRTRSRSREAGVKRRTARGWCSSRAVSLWTADSRVVASRVSQGRVGSMSSQAAANSLREGSAVSSEMVEFAIVRAARGDDARLGREPGLIQEAAPL